MKQFSSVFVLALLSLSSFAQRGGRIEYQSRCPEYNYCADCGDQKAVFLGKLKKYFEKEINFRDLDIIEGVIIVRVAVDSVGHACAARFYNRTANTPDEVERLQLDRIIERMPQWEPAVFSGVQVNTYVMLAFYSHVDKHGIFDVNYLRNDKDKSWYVINSNNERILMYFDETAERN